MRHDIDLVVVFRASSPSIHISKHKARIDAQHAEDQYTRLLETLRKADLYAVGRRGEHQGQLILLVSCSNQKLQELLQREWQAHYYHSDFLHGLSTSASNVNQDQTTLNPAERLRLVYTYVTATPSDGGLGIHPHNDSWSRIESIMALHDPKFNDVWIRSVTTLASVINIGHDQLDIIRTQFGEAIALYFAFLVSYTRALFFISVAGFACYYSGKAYSFTYSSLLFLWSVVFVEYWRIRERLHSVTWGCLGSDRVEQHLPSFAEGHPWWKRELKILVSVPIIALFASILAVLLTAIFIFEAFVTTLYTGPGHEYISFAPTVIFTAVIPQFLAIYRRYARRLTQWENHEHQSSFDASLTTKSFVLSSIVSYLGMVLRPLSMFPLARHSNTVSSLTSSGFDIATEKSGRALFVSDANMAHAKLNRSRLQKEMFAYMVTNQASNFFMEVGLPFLTRAFASVRSGKRRPSLSGASAVTPKKKRSGGARDEREFLERVRREVSLPQYGLFEDYDEMVTQFGYVALWSTIWPLAPLMALLNNVIELPSDAFKIVTHFRHPLPTRTDTIGPWLDCLSYLAWLSALTNSALVYLFHPTAAAAVGLRAPLSTSAGAGAQHVAERGQTRDVVVRALFIALAASHGYIILRAAVRHVLVRVLWIGSAEKARMDDATRESVQSAPCLGVGPGLPVPVPVPAAPAPTSTPALAPAPVPAPDPARAAEGKVPLPASPPLPPDDEFWQFDEGIDEIRKGIKEA
ncbi:calcium-activated chloride channel-domain-containing protein [Lactifluus subvellereus]|nr:calcium-activated chloride channel-domain-containing protein [Lactifluus subvellereus]